MVLGRKLPGPLPYSSTILFNNHTLPPLFFVALSLPDIPHIDLVFIVSSLLEFLLYERVDIVSLVLYL